ncbi:MAG TPA: hypothetical protein VK358_07800, partial [Longimicrobium sp.]|nr:hypothetical protein [Longimicrobium sp.]
MQTPGDLDRALEAAEEAMELDSANAAALYNRALALERIGLADAADDAWRTYLRVDDDSGWADEARGWLRHTVVADVAPPAAPTPASAAEFARRAPQQANAWGWETLLPAWAAARDSGHAAAADSALRLAESVGAALVTVRRDATLADAVAAIRAADPAGAARLARAHSLYGKARGLYESGDRPAAEPLFARAAADGAGSPTLQMWARLFHGAALAYSADPAAMSEIEAVVAGADSARHPALAGRARWILGNTLALQNRHEEARNSFVRSARLLDRADEDEHLAFVQFLTANSLHRMGSEAAADQEGHRAMLRLRAYPLSGWRHVVLISAATRAHESGLLLTALQYHAEDVRVTEQAGKPIHIVEARAARARLLTALGQTEAGLRDVMTTRPLMPKLRAEAQEWARHDLLEVRASHRLRHDPAGAAILLDSVVDFHARRPPRLLSALLTRAQARLASSNEPGARADLHAAADVILDRATAIRTAHLRSALFEQARHVFDQMVMASVTAGDHRQALEQMESARTVFARLPRDQSARIRSRVGEAAIQYAVIGDTLLTWVVTADTVRLVRQTADRRRL